MRRYPRVPWSCRKGWRQTWSHDHWMSLSCVHNYHDIYWGPYLTAHHHRPEPDLVNRINAVLVVLIYPCRTWPWTWLKTYKRLTLNIINWAKLDLRSTSACLYLHQLLHHKTIKIILSYLNSVILISCKYLVFRCRWYHIINTILTDQCMHTPTFTKFYFKNVYFQKCLKSQ